MLETTVVEILAVFIFGALVGSFLNVCAYRLPKEESVIRPGSRCPHCKSPIKWYDNIPILSFLWLRGRCRNCGGQISWRYPLVELITALLSVAVYLRFGLTPAYLGFFFLVAALWVASLIDLEHQIIPDEISLIGILVGLAFSLYNPLTTPTDALLGALCGAGGLYLLAEFYYFFTKREGLGGGDLKLLAMIGAFLGVKSLIPVVFLASLVGAVIGIALALWQKAKDKRTFAIPFGPFLSLGAVVYLFFAPYLKPFFPWL
ncbi:Prepilin peptidase [Thermodesulfatator indicus DSM 15286]|uniref:Prepilin leader peptidase/N-methyltransferase n=1 Tax=Thermodesulfatator indicus (strain DSM 15286 / JCM 11887 / CIR29812) TaxID=667014 RepID=F8A8U1_THEID|nr:A24 family peptidase [Thermodesulfatator indicus]AEH45132.1 Prepilin peptidase [Thermodesulfatator indicus DSM 15286]